MQQILKLIVVDSNKTVFDQNMLALILLTQRLRRVEIFTGIDSQLFSHMEMTDNGK